MKFLFKYSGFFFLLLHLPGFSQETTFPALDSVHSSYHIVTLKDGTVLKGKLVKQERRTIQFEDEMIGKVNFRARDVASMEKVEPQDCYLITMMNGTVLQGKIISRNEKEIIVETSTVGKINVDVSKIKTIKAITPDKYSDGKYWFNTHVDVHYFISPSSIPLRPGEVFYQNTMGVYNSFNVGITNNLSCTGGIIIPTIAFIAPHLSYKISKGIYAAAGAMFSVRAGKFVSNIGYGTLSFGNRNSHLTVGGGYGYLTFETGRYYHRIKKEAYVTTFTVSGMKRIAPRYALVTENWFALDEGFKILTGGLRLMGEKSSWDFGMGSVTASRKVVGQQISIGPLTFISYMRNF